MSSSVLLCRQRQRTACLRTLYVAIIFAFTSGGFTAEFIPLGPTNGPGSTAYAISDDGRVVMGTAYYVEWGLFQPDRQVFRWTRETGMVPLIDTNSQIASMSADGSTIVVDHTIGDNIWHTKVWTEDVGLLEFDQDFGGSGPQQISRDGSVVVGYHYQDDRRDPPYGLVRWTPQNGLQSLNFAAPERQLIENLRPSSDGTVITGEIRSRVTSDGVTQLFSEPIRWTDQGGLTRLEGISGHTYSSVTGSSDDGSVIAGASRVSAPGSALNTPFSLWIWTEEQGLRVLADGTPEFSFLLNQVVGSNLNWLSADGTILVGDARPLDRDTASVVRWTEQTGLEVLPQFQKLAITAVKDMTPDGKWLAGIGASQSGILPADEYIPWLWSEDTGFLNLLEVFEAQGLSESIQGWSSFVRGDQWISISDDARAVIGNGINSGGQSEGWIAYLDPLDIVGDFNRGGELDVSDIDLLTAQVIAGANDSVFDLTADAVVNNADLDQWLADAAIANGFAAPYLLGDANLDGTVNALDLNKLGQSWLASPNAWQWGDFNADGIVDGGDLNELAQNWLMSISTAASTERVPEPSGICLMWVLACLFTVKSFRATS